MGSGGYIKNNYQNDKYERHNYDNFIATNTIIEETNEEMNDFLSDDDPFELINDRDYQKEVCKEFFYIIEKIFIFLNGIISKLFKKKK